jgi:hypothetical protein
LEIVDYQSIRRRVKGIGKEESVRRRAKELQLQLKEPGCNVPFKDAYVMAYNEIVVDRISF